MSTRCFGIDLGTTCSTIGFVDQGRPRLLSFDGDELLPSVVSFPESGTPLVGRPALNRLVLDPERTVRSAKRHMGTEQRWLIGDEFYSPAQIGALVLGRLCDQVERELGERPRRVVITTPAWFTQAQRADTRAAGELAGLEVVRLLNEPTAAALAHAHGVERTRRVLVYDLGGGTFDISLVDQDRALLEVRASHGDSLLGGDDFDRELSELVLERLQQEDPDFAATVRASPVARTKLLQAIEAAKIDLSTSTVTTLRVPFLVEVAGEPRHLEQKIERSSLESLIDPYLDRTLALLEETLRDAGTSPREIDELILVGGSTRMPRVWQRLFEKTGLEGSAAIEPDRAVGLGAAIQAAMVDGSRVDGILVDVAPFSLSTAAIEGAGANFTCAVITPRNAPIPSKHSHAFFTEHPFQPTVRIELFQGSDPNPLRNLYLGSVELGGLPPAPGGRSGRPIDVVFHHDLSGMVEAEVVDRLTGKTVRERFAADGMESAELRAELMKTLEERDLVPGDGSDPDPFCRAGRKRDETARFSVLPGGGRTEPSDEAHSGDERPDPALKADGEEARAMFETLLGNGSKLMKSHAQEFGELKALAERGLSALADEQREKAVRLYDELSDRMFELGIYL